MSTLDFKDNFSKQADIYARYRPHYPEELYRYLSSLTLGHKLAWDCGTGNGQAAVGLAAYYDQVIATDPSARQIRNCFAHHKVKYLVEKAEQTSIEASSVDLLTVANALHWFNLETFYPEAGRVLKNGGIIAAWCYAIPSVSEEIDKILNAYHYITLDAFWQPENRIVEKEYSTLPFPFPEISSPQFFSEKMMALDDVISYLNTWSGTQRFILAKGYNPTEQVREQLLSLWPDPRTEKNFRWKLALKVGRVEKQM